MLSPRHFHPHGRLLVSLACLALVALASAAEPVSVLLKGHDEPISGWLRQVSESRYFLQGRDLGYEVTYEVPRSQIVSVDGKPEVPAEALGSGRLLEYDTYEVIGANGDVEVWSRTVVANDARVRTEVKFGARTDELPLYRGMEAFDQYGNRLVHRVEPRGGDLHYVVVELVVPVGYMEPLVLSLKSVRPGAAVQRSDGAWTYTLNPDFPEDRLYTRKVSLPEGATFVDATPAAKPWPDVQPATIYWRRYYPARTDEPMVITYRLP